jgi:hypothetical protein
MLLIVAAALFLAAAPYAYALDVTSEPDATITQQQKLGPNVYSRRVGNRIYTTRGAYAYYPHYRYRHYRHWR